MNDVRNYIRQGKLWQAFAAPGKVVLLIDEIDKADIEFPNDLLQELDRMEFFVYETGETVGARIARSSSSPRTTKRNCPTPSCAAASSTTSAFPTPRRWQRIVDVHFPGIKERLLTDGADAVLRDPRDAGAEEEALDLRGAGLAEAAAGRGSRARGSARATAQAPCRSCTARC